MYVYVCVCVQVCAYMSVHGQRLIPECVISRYSLPYFLIQGLSLTPPIQLELQARMSQECCLYLLCVGVASVLTILAC